MVAGQGATAAAVAAAAAAGTFELEHILFRLHNRVSRSAASVFDLSARRFIEWVLVTLCVIVFAVFGLLHVRYVGFPDNCLSRALSAELARVGGPDAVHLLRIRVVTEQTRAADVVRSMLRREAVATLVDAINHNVSALTMGAGEMGASTLPPAQLLQRAVARHLLAMSRLSARRAVTEGNAGGDGGRRVGPGGGSRPLLTSARERERQEEGRITRHVSPPAMQHRPASMADDDGGSRDMLRARNAATAPGYYAACGDVIRGRRRIQFPPPASSTRATGTGATTPGGGGRAGLTGSSPINGDDWAEAPPATTPLARLSIAVHGAIDFATGGGWPSWHAFVQAVTGSAAWCCNEAEGGDPLLPGTDGSSGVNPPPTTPSGLDEDGGDLAADVGLVRRTLSDVIAALTRVQSMGSDGMEWGAAASPPTTAGPGGGMADGDNRAPGVHTAGNRRTEVPTNVIIAAAHNLAHSMFTLSDAGFALPPRIQAMLSKLAASAGLIDGTTPSPAGEDGGLATPAGMAPLSPTASPALSLQSKRLIQLYTSVLQGLALHTAADEMQAAGDGGWGLNAERGPTWPDMASVSLSPAAEQVMGRGAAGVNGTLPERASGIPASTPPLNTSMEEVSSSCSWIVDAQVEAALTTLYNTPHMLTLLTSLSGMLATADVRTVHAAMGGGAGGAPTEDDVASLSHLVLLHPLTSVPTPLRPPGEPSFLYSLDRGFLTLSPPRRDAVGVTLSTLDFHYNTACVATTPLLRWLLRHLVGYDTAILNAVVSAAGGAGYVVSEHTAQTHALSHAREVERFVDGGVLSWLLFKVGTFCSAVFLLFAASSLVSFILAQTQQRMLRFTIALQHHVRAHLPLLPLVISHMLDSLVFVPIMLGVLFFLFEFFSDQLLAFLVLIAVWMCELWSITSCRTVGSIRVFPRVFGMFLSWFLVYYLTYPYGYHYLALACAALALITTIFHLWNRYELPALVDNVVTLAAPRVPLVAKLMNVAVAPPQPHGGGGGTGWVEGGGDLHHPLPPPGHNRRNSPHAPTPTPPASHAPVSTGARMPAGGVGGGPHAALADSLPHPPMPPASGAMITAMSLPSPLLTPTTTPSSVPSTRDGITHAGAGLRIDSGGFPAGHMRPSSPSHPHRQLSGLSDASPGGGAGVGGSGSQPARRARIITTTASPGRPA